MYNNSIHINSLSLQNKIPVNLRFTGTSNIHIKNSNMNTTTKVTNFSNIRLELDPNKVLFAPDLDGIIIYEEFKDVPDYEESYQISTFGRVKSLKRYIKYSKGGLRIVNEKILRQQSTKSGYLFIRLSNKCNATNFRINQLMAITFLRYEKKMYENGYGLVVDHINNIRTDNRLENLQVITHRKNISKDVKGTSKYTGVSWNKQSKKWISQIRTNKKWIYLGIFDTEEEASEYYQSALKCIESDNYQDIKIKKPNFLSKYNGVTWSKLKNKWIGQKTIGGKSKYVGYFKTELEAYNAVLNYKIVKF